MKELDKLKRDTDRINSEISVKKKKEVEYKLQNSIRPMEGHRVWEINPTTLEVKEAQKVVEESIHWFEAVKLKNSGYKQRIQVRKGMVYISALNGTSALKRYKKNKGNAQKHDGFLDISEMY